ncbi:MULTISPECIES: hypothetical protein [unclassified Streptomyces]|uniref:hypothetical protein n=1 Tax=unclassified Streptomyces TaxID=2593676 RepID=UPI00336ABEF7
MNRGQRAATRAGVGVFVLAGCVLVVDGVLQHHDARAAAVAVLTVGLLVVARGSRRSS